MSHMGGDANASTISFLSILLKSANVQLLQTPLETFSQFYQLVLYLRLQFIKH
jgi:hypothetical protein